MSQEIDVLKVAVEQLPYPYRANIMPLVDQVSEKYEVRHKLLKMIQEALAEIRVNLKYLQFDLEATRRERDEALAKLGNMENNNDG